jgi:inner membrane protein
MEPVTHMLTGACLARAGFNRKAAYATLAMAIAAEFPDIDTLWSLRGPVEGFTHHRGITHTFIGLPFEAALLVAGVYGLHRWRLVRAQRKPSQKPLTVAPVRWGLLYGFTLIALLSHLLLDFTNNYGIRPFFPFNPRWYAASIVFIFDPLIFLMLLAAIVAPWLFGLIGSEVGARRDPFRGRGWAIAALIGILASWTLRETQHVRALQFALAQSVAEPQSPNSPSLSDADDATPAPDAPLVFLQPQRALASPDPVSPFRWYTVSDFGRFYQLADVDSLSGSLQPEQAAEPKINADAAVTAAEKTRLGRAYLDWSPMPFIDVSTDYVVDGHHSRDEGAGGDPAPPGYHLVTFRDPRFMGDTLLLNMSGRVPITGKVELDEKNRVVRQSLDGKEQH